ncbi:hypothetical protein DH2020_036471 [Rehmannia glutinosa]|uniref:Sulfotransferase n=1 Tax=Rehmannia glutinosa TaxID=99300 RepID=A0ABR0V639_REHGL
MEKREDPKDEVQELLQTLEQQTNWDGSPLVKYDGTTWSKALNYSIVNRNVYAIDQSPLLTCNPHALLPPLEHDLYYLQDNPDLGNIPSPRIFSSHIPFNVLPASIRESKCKIIYLCRNPLDQFISHRHFSLKNKFQKDVVPLELDEAFDRFCQGIHSSGPFWDHMLGFWNAHLKNPEKVLFLKYEDLKEDIAFHIRKIAEFLGYPFTEEEEKQRLVEQIAKLCSFENLKNLEVNRSGYVHGVVEKSSFFRKGEVGDWTNYLTPAMAERFREIMESKFGGTGLMFKI